MKFLIVFLLTCFNAMAINAVAQQSSKPVAYYLGKLGEVVDVKDSAQNVLVMNGYDAVMREYSVSVYDAKSSQKVMDGTTSRIYPLVLEGICVRYHISGKRESVVKYHKGNPTDTALYYYPNGNPYKTVFYKNTEPLINTELFLATYKAPVSVPDFEKSSLVTAYDSTGHQTVSNGKGHFIGYDDDFKIVTEEGDIKDGQKNGDWKGTTSRYTYTEQYVDGKLQNGVSTDRSGKQHPYNQVLDKAGFTNGIDAFYQFLARTVRYPTVARERNIQGRVTAAFIIDESGTLNSIRCLAAPSEDLAAESMRVLLLSPKWKPGFDRGIAIKQLYTVPITFSLSK